VTGEDGSTDTAPVEVEVEPRKWKTQFTWAAEGRMSGDLNIEVHDLGKNRCAEGETVHHHYIHKKHRGLDKGESAERPTVKPEDLTWRDVGYKLAQATRGPFQGYWYVSESTLKVFRKPFINSRLLAGGDIWKLNQKDPERRADLDLLVRQIREHEFQHGELARKRLAELDPDPAMQIEPLAGMDEKALVQLVDGLIGSADTELATAAGEDPVKAQLQHAPFLRGGTVIVRQRDNTGETGWPIEAYWMLGDK
jgi:hypothetical protein